MDEERPVCIPTRSVGTRTSDFHQITDYHTPGCGRGLLEYWNLRFISHLFFGVWSLSFLPQSWHQIEAKPPVGQVHIAHIEEFRSDKTCGNGFDPDFLFYQCPVSVIQLEFHHEQISLI